jgi:hypothetical protein
MFTKSEFFTPEEKERGHALLNPRNQFKYALGNVSSDRPEQLQPT